VRAVTPFLRCIEVVIGQHAKADGAAAWLGVGADEDDRVVCAFF
jgi:hypothetical protein